MALFAELKLKVLKGLSRGMGVDIDRIHDAANQKRKRARKHGRNKKLHTGVELKTFSSAMEVEDWLESHARGKFTVGVENVDNESGEKTLEVMFEHNEDKVRFLQKFAGRR